MSLYIYPTDHDWFRFLQRRSDLDEVNFWQPGGARAFSRLQPGELFLFRLKHPINRIAGGGYFVHSSLLPVDLAWLAFGEKNGVESLTALQRKISTYKGLASAADLTPVDQIGCIILTAPFFFPESEWLPVPTDYSPNLVQGKRYPVEAGEGRRLFDAVMSRLDLHSVPNLLEPRVEPYVVDHGEVPMWKEGILGRRRLGQGTFRVLVTDAYERRCAVTGERTLPVLEAAHIRPVTRAGEHRVENGLLLRSDIHRLFDDGYVTVTPSLRFKVSPRLAKDWSNGRVYYNLQGTEVRRPLKERLWPAKELLEWHADTVFLR